MLVSCLMPTANRREFLPLAIACWKAQDWPMRWRELVVIDDGTDRVEDLFKDVEGCAYIRVAGPQCLGAKRNLACEAARGEILVHWDDDDWSAVSRVTDQVVRLLLSRALVGGYRSLLFWNEARQEASRYGCDGKTDADYALGTSLCYRRSYWQAHPFLRHESKGEDNVFIRPARERSEIVTAHGGAMMVARLHARNTIERPSPPAWPLVDAREIPRDFFAMLAACAVAH
jgi:glycosyltransferase involved in cell wall biosynthesis